MKPDTRSVFVAFLGITIALVGAKVLSGFIEGTNTNSEKQNEILVTQLKAEQATNAALNQKILELTSDQIKLREELVRALDAAELKAESNAQAEILAKQQAEQVKLEEQVRIFETQRVISETDQDDTVSATETPYVKPSRRTGAS